jgi:hypothetical protein
LLKLPAKYETMLGWLHSLERANTVQPPEALMKFTTYWLLLFASAALVVVSTGCTPSDSAGVDNSAALHSVGLTPDESTDYQPTRSPSQEDPFKGSR